MYIFHITMYVLQYCSFIIECHKLLLRISSYIIVTGPAKTGHICTNYTCSEKGTFLGAHA